MAVGFYVDMHRCTGCRACQVACKDKNRLDVGIVYREAHAYSVGSYPDVKCFSYSQSCNHCDDPACLKNCPVGAIYKAPDGTVIQDPNMCIGCRMCVMSCPYGHPKYNSETHVSGKCDGCYAIREAGGNPACVAGCPNRALDFGDVDELKKKYGADNEGDITILPSPQLTHPNVVVKTKDAATDGNCMLVNW